MVDALFRAYFEEARDIGDAAVLAEIAARRGVSGWPQQADGTQVAALEEDVRDLGIAAVPTFILDRKRAFRARIRPRRWPRRSAKRPAH